MKLLSITGAFLSLTYTTLACTEIHCDWDNEQADGLFLTAQVYDNGNKVCNVATSYMSGDDPNSVATFDGVAGGCISDDYKLTVTGACASYTYTHKSSGYTTSFQDIRTADYTIEKCVCRMDGQGNCSGYTPCYNHEVCAKDGFADCNADPCRLCDGKADCDDGA